MKTTIPKLKKKIAKLTSDTGCALLRSNPYYANYYQIKAIEEAIELVVWNGEEHPDRFYTVSEAQKKSLDNWVIGLKHKFLLGL